MPSSDKFSFTFVDLVKFDKQRTASIEDMSLEEKFYYFLRHAEEVSNEDLAKVIGRDEIIQRAFSELDRFNWSEQERLLYEKEEKRVKDNEAVLDFAERKGREEAVSLSFYLAIKAGVCLCVKTASLKEGRDRNSSIH